VAISKEVMMLTVTWTELISWLLTVVSVVLFIVEKQRNSRLPYYMAIQGILRACKEKAGFYATYYSTLKGRSDSQSITKEEFLLFTETVYADYRSLMEHIMGSLKAIEPKKDMPFDTGEFTESRKRSPSADAAN
jgi:hypothetical protein